MRFRAHDSLAARLRALRLDAQKSQEEFSAMIGISRSALANYEAGKRMPDYKTIIKIANACNMTSDELTDTPLPHQSIYCNETAADRNKRLRALIDKQRDQLDISKLSPEHRLSILDYYDYVLLLQQQKTDRDRRLR